MLDNAIVSESVSEKSPRPYPATARLTSGGGYRARRGVLVGGLRRREGRRRRRLRRSRLRRLLLDHAQPRHVLLVLLVVVGEGVAAGAVGDEKQFLGARRIGGGFERGAARIGDRPRRQPVDDIGVVGRRLLDLVALDRPPERALAADQPVDDRRIGLQLHLLPQPVDEHRGHPRALLGLAGFLLDDRSQRHELLRRLDRQVGAAAIPDLLHRALLRLPHALDHLLARGAEREPVGFRQQGAFARHVADVAGERFILDQTLHDLVRGQTLRDGEGVLHHLALDDGIDHVAQACVPGEAVLAVFQFVLRLEHQRAGDEQIGLIDDAFAHQQIGGVADAAARDVDHLVLGERARQIETLLAEHEGDAADHGDQEDDGEQRIAGDDDRVARALGTRGPRRHRHVLGLQRRARAALRHRSWIDRRGAVEPRRLQGWIRLAGAGDGARTWRRQWWSGLLRQVGGRSRARAGRSIRTPADRRCGGPWRLCCRGIGGRRRLPGRWSSSLSVARRRIGPRRIRRRSRPACTGLRRALRQLRPKRGGVLRNGRRSAGRLWRRRRGPLRRAGRRRAQADGRDLRRQAADWLKSPPTPRLHARRTPVTKDFKDGPK